MPQQDMSGRIGKSSSPVIERVIKNNENVQQPIKGDATKQAFNKKPVKS